MSAILHPSASYSITMRVRLPQRPGAFGQVASAIGRTGAILGAIDLVGVERGMKLREVTTACVDAAHGERLVEAVREVDGVTVEGVLDRTFAMHETWSPSSATAPPCCVSATSAPSRHARHEGKALMFRELAGVDAFPLCLATTDVETIVAFVEAVAPTFGGINLEDIAAPRCFEIERRLRDELDVPVFHDDQHGTAIVVLAALLNALVVVGKRIEDVRVVVTGAGAAGTACTNILLGAGVLLGMSAPGAVSAAAVRTIAPGAIVFALVNPTPEVMPEEIHDAAAIVATGRSDYPNQINDVLAFPGVFRGALDVRANDRRGDEDRGGTGDRRHDRPRGA
jgi:malate dehydrogenase (oxaloacetate-decarboxylating)